MSTSPRTKARPMTDPHDEPIYRAILAVLVGSVLAGAVLALTGEPLFDSRPLANVGVGMAVLCFLLYWVFRFIGRRAARRRDAERHDGERHGRERRCTPWQRFPRASIGRASCRERVCPIV